MRVNVTLYVDKRLYDLAKQKLAGANLSISRVLEICLQAIVGSSQPEEAEYNVREAILRTYRDRIQQSLADIQREIERLRAQCEQLKNDLKNVDSQINELQIEYKYHRLQRLLGQLRMLARMCDFDYGALVNDENAQMVLQQIREIRPDFDVRRWLEVIRHEGMFW